MDEITVSELGRRIKETLEAPFAEVAVAGEISNFRGPHHSGHVYCNFKDAGAQIRLIIWRGTFSRLRFELSDGLEVTIVGKLDVYVRRGEYSLVAESIQPKGLGDLQLAFQQMVERLEAEGLFEDEHKQPLPAYPRRIGVVTSPTGAAVRDVITTAKRRNPHVELFVFPAKVQGDGAAEEIARAIESLNRRNDELGLDLLIVGRGGGSLEDLWAFNEEAVARAIFASRIPVVSAVGHEVDTTIADLVADLRAPTPTAAAELAVPELEGMRELALDYRLRLARALRQTVTGWGQELTALAARLRASGPLNRLLREQQRLDYALENLHGQMRGRLRTARHESEALGARLEDLNPLSVLKRGYSITRAADGTVLRSAKEAAPGSVIRTTLADGEIASRVEG